MNAQTIDVVLPDGAIFGHAITVASYFNTEGEMGWMLQTTGDAHASSVVGLMELAKARVIAWADE